MRKIVLTFGLISGGILAVLMLIAASLADRIGYDKGVYLGYATMVAGFLMIYFGVRSYRDNVAGGTISFGRGFTVGLLIMLIASTCYVASWEFVGAKMMPNFLEDYSAATVAQARAEGKSAEEVAAIEQHLAQFKEAYKHPLIRIAYTYLEPLPVGLIFTLVSAGLLRRRKGSAAPEPASAMVA
jgi:hypothetical protein